MSLLWIAIADQKRIAPVMYAIASAQTSPAIFDGMRLGNRMHVYWLSQICGWGLFVMGNIVSASIQDEPFRGIYVVSFFILVVGILVTHVFRNLVHRWSWKRLNIPQLIPRMLFSAVIMSAVFTTFNTLLTDLLGRQIPFATSLLTITFWLNLLNFSALFLLWEIIYFAVNIFENWKREEILNLELRAAKTEIELNSLKSQMNPHFMFNSMNSIRALVDENPEKAKQAITMLSGILRNNLTLGRFQIIPLRDEIDLVDKYLSLEKIRFEERLTIHFDIDPETLLISLPPFVLQTIVENAIKHGISKRMQGGSIDIVAFLENENMHITITNSGKFLPKNNLSGIGLNNTRSRLDMIYNGKASMTITSGNDLVKVHLIIPKN